MVPCPLRSQHILYFFKKKNSIHCAWIWAWAVNSSHIIIGLTITDCIGNNYYFISSILSRGKELIMWFVRLHQTLLDFRVQRIFSKFARLLQTFQTSETVLRLFMTFFSARGCGCDAENVRKVGKSIKKSQTISEVRKVCESLANFNKKSHKIW